MPCNTDLMIKKETDEIVKALDTVEFDSPKFNDWLNSKKFEPDLYKGTITYKCRFGHTMFLAKTLCGRVKVVACSYIPFGTNEGMSLMAQGRSISGKSLSNEEIEELEKIQAEENRTYVEKNVIYILAEESGVAADEITPETNLKSDLLLEEFDIEGIVPALEDEFDCVISDEHFQEWQTVGDIISTIKNISGA